MNKSQAKQEGASNTRTVAELRALVEARKAVVPRHKPSKVIPSMFVWQICDIFLEALKDRPDDEVPSGTKWPPHRDGTNVLSNLPSDQTVLVRNILRDCA